MISIVEDEKIQEQKQYMEKVKSLCKGLKYFIHTMGCKLNENDSEKMAGMLEEMGYVPTDSVQDGKGETICWERLLKCWCMQHLARC